MKTAEDSLPPAFAAHDLKVVQWILKLSPVECDSIIAKGRSKWTDAQASLQTPGAVWRDPGKNRIPRPRNSFLLFRCVYCEAIQFIPPPPDKPRLHTSLGARRIWHANPIFRELFQPLSELEKQYHKNIFHNYKFHLRRPKKAVDGTTTSAAQKLSPVSDWSSDAEFSMLSTSVSMGVLRLGPMQGFNRSSPSPSSSSGASDVPLTPPTVPFLPSFENGYMAPTPPYYETGLVSSLPKSPRISHAPSSLSCPRTDQHTSDWVTSAMHSSAMPFNPFEVNDPSFSNTGVPSSADPFEFPTGSISPTEQFSGPILCKDRGALFDDWLPFVEPVDISLEFSRPTLDSSQRGPIQPDPLASSALYYNYFD
ncbi:hypothetical protein DL96DRAFT_1714142 [Flagelloscypha sp. PMI_526]|nr:hypothetical protein DL96DRAFT_1714142 [Flagelloscypha sp. PMI_526]